MSRHRSRANRHVHMLCRPIGPSPYHPPYCRLARSMITPHECPGSRVIDSSSTMMSTPLRSITGPCEARYNGTVGIPTRWMYCQMSSSVRLDKGKTRRSPGRPGQRAWRQTSQRAQGGQQLRGVGMGHEVVRVGHPQEHLGHLGAAQRPAGHSGNLLEQGSKEANQSLDLGRQRVIQ